MQTILWPLRFIPVIIRAGRHPLDDREHRHTYNSPTHALHLYEYDGEIRLDGTPYPLRHGVATFSPSGFESSYHLPHAGHHWCAHFETPPAIAPAIDLPCWIDLGPRKSFAIARFKQIVAMQAQANDATPLGQVAAAGAAVQLQDLLLWIAHTHLAGTIRAADRAGDSAVNRTADILNTRFSEAISVPDLADEVALTQNYLAKRFKRRIGMTIPHYLLTCRIQHAQLLLETTNIPIQRIAQRVALPDLQHFNKQFRRLVGSSPSGYREGRRIHRRDAENAEKSQKNV